MMSKKLMLIYATVLMFILSMFIGLTFTGCEQKEAESQTDVLVSDIESNIISEVEESKIQKYENEFLKIESEEVKTLEGLKESKIKYENLLKTIENEKENIPNTELNKYNDLKKSIENKINSVSKEISEKNKVESNIASKDTESKVSKPISKPVSSKVKEPSKVYAKPPAYGTVVTSVDKAYELSDACGEWGWLAVTDVYTCYYEEESKLYKWDIQIIANLTSREYKIWEKYCLDIAESMAPKESKTGTVGETIDVTTYVWVGEKNKG